MHRSSRLTRVLWRLTALLQLVLPTFVATADAQLEREAVSARAYSHVEEGTGKDCARAHRSDCALCQHLTTGFTKPAKAPPPIPSARPDLPPAERAVAQVAQRDLCPALPRAPPAA